MTSRRRLSDWLAYSAGRSDSSLDGVWEPLESIVTGRRQDLFGIYKVVSRNGAISGTDYLGPDLENQTLRFKPDLVI